MEPYDWSRDGAFDDATRTPTHCIDAERGAIDEGWLADWVEFGLRELGRYLAKHAAFDRYCKENNR